MRKLSFVLLVTLVGLLESGVNAYSTRTFQPKVCDVNILPLWCYKKLGDPSLKLNELIYNGRDTINWKDYKTSLSRILCTCAAKAKEGGYKVIGIQYYGECWATKADITLDDDDLAGEDRCWTGYGDSLRKCWDRYADKYCAGDADSTYVYIMNS